MKKLNLLILAFGFLLTSCGTTKNAEPIASGYTITGFAQVGVFDSSATTCQAFNLNEKLEPTGSAVTFSLKKDGSFRFLMQGIKYISVECTGRYHNVLQGGALTKDTIRLEAIGNILNNTRINLNLATSLTKAKVKDDFNNGQPFLDTYKTASKKLFAAAGIKDPNIIPTDLDLTNPELQALSRWFLETLSLNTAQSQVNILNAYSDAIQHSKTIKLPSSFTNVPPAPSIGALGINTKVGGSSVTLRPTGIDVAKSVSFVLDASSIKSFDPSFHHVLISGKTGVKAIELQSQINQFISTDVSSLFDGNQQTNFKVCVVSKAMDTCNSIVASQVQTFTATGQAIFTIKPLAGHAFVSGKNVATLPIVDTTERVPFRIDKSIVSKFGSSFHLILVHNSQNTVTFELTDEGTYYGYPDIGKVIEDDGVTSIRICVASRKILDCGTTGSQDFMVATGDNPVFTAVQANDISLLSATNTVQDLMVTKTIIVDPNNVGKLQITKQIVPNTKVYPTSSSIVFHHIIVDSNKPGAIGKEVSLTGTNYSVDLTSLMAKTGETVFKVCIVMKAVKTCSNASRPMLFTLTAK